MKIQSQKFATILTFTYPHEVSVAQSRLESEGIQCFVEDLNPLYFNATGGVNLKVREEDLDRAKEILRESGYVTDNEK